MYRKLYTCDDIPEGVELYVNVSLSFACSGAHSKRVGGSEEPQVSSRLAEVDSFERTRLASVLRNRYHAFTWHALQETHDGGPVCNEQDEEQGAANCKCHILCTRVC